ncbi:Eco57I restriction-modification methylase domain-containing protein, partial [Salmonella enterica]
GNPPYGKVSLDTEVREKFSRSLFGHANLYGLFTDLALRLAKPEGVIAYLTPTSFLGGQYFKALRELLIDESAPRAFDFISNREGVFDDVLQETLLATFKKSARKTPA